MSGNLDWGGARTGGTSGGWYHCRVSTMSRASGRSAVAAAAYRTGEFHDDKLGYTHDYARRSGVLYSYSLAPEDAPDWARDTETLWNAAEATEKRKNSVVARECELALPASVSAEERAGIASAFAEELVNRYGVAVTVALHAPSRHGDDRNFHAHIMWTTRELGPDGFGAKTRVLDDMKGTGPEEVRYLREFAADRINEALERAGLEERVDERSFKDRGIDREPTQHLGPSATEIERQGRESERGDRNREIEEQNARLDQLVEELRAVDAAIAEEQERALDTKFGPAGEPPEIAVDKTDTAPAGAASETSAAPTHWLFERYGASVEREIITYGEVQQADGMTWWQRTVVCVSHWRENAVEWTRTGWQRVLDAWNGSDPGDPGPDEPSRER